VISNRYGFIFIHTPKTGGTSIANALNRDTEGTCSRIVYAKEHDEYIAKVDPNGAELANLYTVYDNEITHIYPSLNTFDWWRHWYIAEQNMAKKTENFFVKSISFEEPEDSLMISNCSLITSMVFGRGGYNANIKHLPFYFWAHLLCDPRLIRYNTFKEKYHFVGTTRNPYSREFSVFLYFNNKILQDKSKGLKKPQIIKMLQSEWQLYTSQWPTLGAEYSTAIERPANPTNENPTASPSANIYGSQTAYLFVPMVSNEGNIILQSVSSFIRLENIEDDYINFCEKVGIDKKGKVPHSLSNQKTWKKYLPENIIEWYSDENLKDIHRFRHTDFHLLGYERVK